MESSCIPSKYGSLSPACFNAARASEENSDLLDDIKSSSLTQ